MYSTVDGVSNDIHNVKFSTSNGQVISGTADESGNHYSHTLTGPLIGVYIYYDLTSLQDIGLYHGTFRSGDGCTCCSSAIPSPTAWTGDFATTDPF